MLLYTIVPPELIFEETSPQPRAGASRCRKIRGGMLEMTMTGDDDGRISRLISTDPKLYLNPRYSPGSRWKPGGGQ